MKAARQQLPQQGLLPVLPQPQAQQGHKQLLTPLPQLPKLAQARAAGRRHSRSQVWVPNESDHPLLRPVLRGLGLLRRQLSNVPPCLLAEQGRLLAFMMGDGALRASYPSATLLQLHVVGADTQHRLHRLVQPGGVGPLQAAARMGPGSCCAWLTHSSVQTRSRRRSGISGGQVPREET